MEEPKKDKWGEFIEKRRAWEENPVVQLSYYEDDSFYSPEGEYYHVPHFESYLLDAENDIQLLKRIKVLNQTVIKNTSYLYLPDTVLLKGPPKTVEEVVELVEKYNRPEKGK